MILDDKELRIRLTSAFPKAFINRNLEFIAYPRQNTYFRLEDVFSELDLKCKVLEWLSREAAKSLDKKSQVYHLNGINEFLGTNFSQDEMMEIYTYIGNNVDREKCIKFIQSGYDLSVLKSEVKEDA